VGAAIFISESWTNVDGLQNSYALHNNYSNWKESIFSVKKCNKIQTNVNTLLDTSSGR
jgi:hypothetical protein